jgi:hypothetical protein
MSKTDTHILLSNGARFDLATITADNYASLTAQFTPQEQILYTNLQRIFETHQETLKINPKAVASIAESIKTAIPRYIQALRSGAESLRESSDEGIKSVQALIDNDPAFAHIMQDFKQNGFVRSAETAQSITDAVERASKLPSFIVFLPRNILHYGSSVLDGLKSGPATEEAAAAATATVLAMREAQRRESANEKTLTEKAGGLWDTIKAHGTVLWDKYVPDIVKAGFRCIGNLVSHGKWDWDAAKQQIAHEKQALATELGNAPSAIDYAALLAHYTHKQATVNAVQTGLENAGDILKGVPNIGDISTAKLLHVASLAEQGGAYQSYEGFVYSLKPSKENPTLNIEQLRAKNGDVVTRNSLASAKTGLPGLPTLLTNKGGDFAPLKPVETVLGIPGMLWLSMFGNQRPGDAPEMSQANKNAYAQALEAAARMQTSISGGVSTNTINAQTLKGPSNRLAGAALGGN